jgi:hypothetical protein
VFEIPNTLVFFVLAVLIIEFALFCLAIYYLFTKDYHSFLFVVSAVIFSSIVFFVANRFAAGSIFSAMGYCSLPFGAFAGVFGSNLILNYFVIAVGVVINYLSVFAIVNSIHKILGKMF